MKWLILSTYCNSFNLSGYLHDEPPRGWHLRPKDPENWLFRVTVCSDPPWGTVPYVTAIPILVLF